MNTTKLLKIHKMLQTPLKNFDMSRSSFCIWGNARDEGIVKSFMFYNEIAKELDITESEAIHLFCDYDEYPVQKDSNMRVWRQEHALVHFEQYLHDKGIIVDNS